MKSINDLLRDYRTAQAGLEKTMRDIPRILGAEAVRIVKDNFRLQGYDTGSGVTAWPQRKRSTNKKYDSRSGSKGSVVNSGNKILDQTGHLKDSIHYEVSGDNATIGVDLNIVAYAQVHNEGGVITKGNRTMTLHFTQSHRFSTPGKAFSARQAKVWAHSYRMTKRQYMPTPYERPNKKILNAFEAKIKFEIDKSMRIFKQ